MSRAVHVSRRRGVLLMLVALLTYALAVLLFVLGVALLFAGLSSWLHLVDVAAAWARTLAGIGLVGCSAGLAALGRLAVGAAGRRERDMSRALKFVAVIGILLALVCLPFAAAIRAAAHAAWFSGA
ncbi:MAG TPA: hypothetical protein VFA39_04515 [Steroidobacteraceae bacterium]|nr:hypothetical protein [Steroidobacteraceae bacterium]